MLKLIYFPTESYKSDLLTCRTVGIISFFYFAEEDTDSRVLVFPPHKRSKKRSHGKEWGKPAYLQDIIVYHTTFISPVIRSRVSGSDSPQTDYR
jgi:hypothetical protein